MSDADGRRESVSEDDKRAYLEAISDKANNPFAMGDMIDFGDIVAPADGKDLVDLTQNGQDSGAYGGGLDLNLIANTPGTGKRGDKVSLGGAYYPESDLKHHEGLVKSPYTPGKANKPGLRSWSVERSSSNSGISAEALRQDNSQRQLGLDILRARGPRTPSGTPILRETYGGASLVGVRSDGSGLTKVLSSRRGLLEPRIESPGIRQRLLRATNRGQDASNKANFYAHELVKSEAAKRKWRDEALRHRHNFSFGDSRIATPVQVKRRQVVKTPELLPQSRKGQRRLQQLSTSDWMSMRLTPKGFFAMCLALYMLRWLVLACFVSSS